MSLILWQFVMAATGNSYNGFAGLLLGLNDLMEVHVKQRIDVSQGKLGPQISVSPSPAEKSET